MFPAIGLAVFATQAKRITDEMFGEAARATATQLRDDQLSKGMLFPQMLYRADYGHATHVAAP